MLGSWPRSPGGGVQGRLAQRPIQPQREEVDGRGAAIAMGSGGVACTTLCL